MNDIDLDKYEDTCRQLALVDVSAMILEEILDIPLEIKLKILSKINEMRNRKRK